MPEVTLHIEGMSCNHCLNAVQAALAAVPGATIKSVQIGRATVEVSADGPTGDQLEAAVSEAGYRATAVPSAN
jgi:copper chaperone CopZ